MRSTDFGRILSWIAATWPRRSKKRNPIEEVHAFFSERLTDSGKAVALLWLASLALAAIPGWGPAKLLFPLFTSVLLVSLAATWRAPKLEVGLVDADRAVEGGTASLRFRLSNRSAKPIEWGGVGLFRAKEGLASREVVGWLPRIEPGGVLDVVVGVECRSRGPSGFPGIAAVRLDPMGIARSRRMVFEPLALDVAPMPMRISPSRFLFGGGSGRAFAEAAGVGGDLDRIFHGVRAFREGDRLRDLDHKAWARWNEPIVREFGASARCGIAVSLETGCGNLLERSLLEPLLRLAAGVSRDFQRRGWLGALVIDGTPVEFRTDSDEDILAVFASMPRCGWGPWRRWDESLIWRDQRRPVLSLCVSRQAAGVDAEGASKRIVVVSRAAGIAESERLLPISVERIGSGEVAL